MQRYDHEFPARHFPWFLRYLDVSEERFWEVMDLYRERSKVWERKNGEWRLRGTVDLAASRDAGEAVIGLDAVVRL